MRAIVLERNDFREYDQQIKFYTRKKGLVQLCAKGIKRSTSKNSSKLEPFSLVDIEIVSGKELSYIASVHVIEIFKEIRAVWLSSLVATNYVKTLSIVVKHELQDKAIFDLMMHYLGLLKGKKSYVHCIVLSTKFLFELGNCLGYEPDLNHCVICKENTGNFFAASHGGIVCIDCSARVEVLSVPQDTLMFLQYLFGLKQKENMGNVKTDVIYNSYQLMRHFLEYHAEQKLPDLVTFSKNIGYARV